MADRYWVNGGNVWNSTNTNNWSETSGGPGGASVPGSADNVFIDLNSGSGTINFTNNSVTISQLAFDNAEIELNLGAALNVSNNITVTSGVFITNSYNVTASRFISSNLLNRTINFDSSTITLTGSGPITTGIFSITESANLIFNSGTSSIIFQGAGGLFRSPGLSFYDVSFTNNSGDWLIEGENSFYNLSRQTNSGTGVKSLIFAANQIIANILSVRGSSGIVRLFVRSNNIGETRTLNCGAVNSGLQDVDFRDINITGPVVPINGARIGDCQGNSGITFPAPKTVYFRGTSGNWGATSSWSTTLGGTASSLFLPLAQDTAIITNSYPSNISTININSNFNIGTIDMSSRTSAFTLTATGSIAPEVYGDWINGSGTNMSGTSVLTFSGRSNQYLRSSGKTFTQSITLNKMAGSLILQDSFITNRAIASAISIVNGSFDANDYNVTSSGGVLSSNSNVRSINIGSGTWTISFGGNAWDASTSRNLTINGSGTINLTNISTSKVFNGGGIQTYPTLNHGGPATLTITGSNKFANLTNTATGTIVFDASITSSLNNILWVNSNFLAVGQSGVILSSPNIYFWRLKNSNVTSTLRSVEWGNSKYVVVGSEGTILTSEDSDTWVPRTSNVVTTLQDVVWNGSQFVAVGSNGIVITSPNGIDWTTRSSGVSSTLNSIEWNGSQFVAVGTTGIVITSPNGIDWTTRSSGVSNTLTNIVWGNNLFVAVGTTGTIITSPDGINWVTKTSNTISNLNKVMWSGLTFVVVGLGGTILTSSNSNTWASRTSNVTTGLLSIAKSNTHFVAVGGAGTVTTSPDTITWTPVEPGFNEFDAFSVSGLSGDLLTVRGVGPEQTVIRRPDNWNVGVNSVDVGNNTGLSFTAGVNDYLSISYINGQLLNPPGSTNIYYGSNNNLQLYYGSTPIISVYYGSTKVLG